MLVNYLLSTGQQLNTVINVKICDIDLESHIIRLKQTKGRRETLLPISSALTTILNEYLEFRKGNDDDFLFCNITGGQMSRGCITCAVRHYNRSRGVSRTSVHLFRHTYAKNYLMKGKKTLGEEFDVMTSIIRNSKPNEVTVTYNADGKKEINMKITGFGMTPEEEREYDRKVQNRFLY